MEKISILLKIWSTTSDTMDIFRLINVQPKFCFLYIMFFIIFQKETSRSWYVLYKLPQFLLFLSFHEAHSSRPLRWARQLSAFIIAHAYFSMGKKKHSVPFFLKVANFILKL